jgi:hypothetical protein
VRGTNFCTDALLGAIYAERGLMAVTADMKHLRNREGQDRHMTTPIAHCVRCQRPAPAEDDPDFLHWEVLDDVDMVCPECETPQEKRAIDEEDMRLADEGEDLSHELRSPITTIRQHAEVALAHPDRMTAAELADVVLAE